MLSLIRALAKISRIEHGVMVSIGILAGVIASTSLIKVLNYSYKIILGCLTGILVEVTLFVFNDIFNIEEDRINSPNRPLVKGEVTIKGATVFGIITLLGGLILAAIVSFKSLILILIIIILGMIYNISLKKRGLLGNLIVAFNTAMPFLYGALIVDALDKVTIWLFYLMAFLSTLGREVIKGIKDLEGDRKVGIETIAVKYGVNKAAKLAALFMVSAVLISLIPVMLVRNPAGYSLLIALTDGLLLYSSWKIVQKPDSSTAGDQRNITLLAMFIGILGFMTSNCC